MSATARNYAYEIKVKKTDEEKESIISKKLLDKCKEVADKYPKKE